MTDPVELLGIGWLMGMLTMLFLVFGTTLFGKLCRAIGSLRYLGRRTWILESIPLPAPDDPRWEWEGIRGYKLGAIRVYENNTIIDGYHPKGERAYARAVMKHQEALRKEALRLNAASAAENSLLGD